MTEAVGQKPLQPFTTIQYTTKDGENITATKNNGVVTLVGDKNGTRQLPLEDFKKELVDTLPQLEKTPDADTVELSTASTADKTENAPAADVNAKTVAEQKVEGQKLDIAG